MSSTFTYTARSGLNSDKVVTMTLMDRQLSVQLTGILDRIDKVRQSEERPDELKRQLQTQVQPLALKAVEGLSGPMHISDITAHMKNGDFKLRGWKRVGGLRLAPLSISIREVDNPNGAEEFIDELEKRKDDTDHPGLFAGPLDYWLGWGAMALGVFALIGWPGRKKERKGDS